MNDLKNETNPPPISVSHPKRRPRLVKPLIIAATLLVVGRGLWQLASKAHSGQPIEAKIPKTVAVVKTIRENLQTDSTLQAEFEPYQDILVHAKVSGYVNMIRVDIGDRVKQGELLATLEIPELQDNLDKARAALSASEQEVAKARADRDNFHLIYQRLLDVAKAHSNLIAQQDLDTAKAKAASAQAALGAAEQHRDGAQAEVGRYNTLIDYQRITAPFSGVITKRFADLGALIQAGTSSDTQSMPLVELAQDNLLRLRFPVPEAQTPLIENGKSVGVTVPALNESFSGKIVRSAWAIDRSTRTMTTEVDVQNPDGRIKAGMYAYIKLPLREARNVLVVPLQALSIGDQPSVFVLTKDGKLQERRVKLGLRTAAEAEVAEGLEEGDLVVVGNPGGLVAGEKVEPKLVALPTITAVKG
jgi:RND family efflux transporter MFP subunit